MQAALAPQQAAYQNQIKQAEIDARNKGVSTQAAYAAAAAQAAPLAGQIGQTYTDAADHQAAYAKGFSDEIQKTLGTATDQSNALLAQNNSPQHLAAPQVGNVLYGLGGTNPATLLNTAGAAFKSAALQQPNTLRGVGLQGYQAAIAEGGANKQHIQDQLDVLNAQKPGLVMSAVTAAKKDAEDKRRFGLTYGLDKKRADDQRWEFGQTYALDKKKANQKDFFGSAEGGYYSYNPATQTVQKEIDGTGPTPVQPIIVGTDKTGRYVWDKSQGTFTAVPGPLGTPAPGSTSTKPKYTVAETKGFKNDAATAAKYAYYGEKDKDGTWLSDPQHYQTALATMVDHGIPLTFAQNALNRYWKKPGFDFDIEKRKKGEFAPARATKGLGRPVRSYQERNPGKASAAAETAGPADWRVALGQEGAGGVWRAPWSVTLSTGQRKAVARQALAKVDRRLASASNVDALVGRMNQESGGQTGIVNKWDSNWQKQIPSIGLLQTIGPTFDSYKLPGHGNIWDPLDNTIAAVRYMIANYGRIVGPSGTGY